MELYEAEDPIVAVEAVAAAAAPAAAETVAAAAVESTAAATGLQAGSAGSSLGGGATALIRSLHRIPPSAKGWGSKPKGHNQKKLKGGDGRVGGGGGGGGGGRGGGGRGGGRGGGGGGLGGGEGAGGGDGDGGGGGGSGGVAAQSWEGMLQASFVTIPLTTAAASTSTSASTDSAAAPPPRWTYPRTEVGGLLRTSTRPTLCSSSTSGTQFVCMCILPDGTQ